MPKDGHLPLSAGEREFILEELRFQLGGAQKSEIPDLELLRESVESGGIPPERIPILERLIEVELSSGTLRGRRGDEGERLAIHLYERTPKGESLMEHLHRLNSSLGSLGGTRVLDARCVVPKFGEWSVLLTTDRAEVMLTFTGAGLQVEMLGLPKEDKAA